MEKLIEQQKKEISDLVEHMKALKKDSKDYDFCCSNLVKMNTALAKLEQQQSDAERKEKERISANEQWEAEQELRVQQQNHREEMDKAEEKRKQLERITAIEQWEAEQKLKEQQMAETHAQFMIGTIVSSVFRIGEDALYVDLTERTWLFEERGNLTTKVWQGLAQRIPWLRKK